MKEDDFHRMTFAGLTWVYRTGRFVGLCPDRDGNKHSFINLEDCKFLAP